MTTRHPDPRLQITLVPVRDDGEAAGGVQVRPRNDVIVLHRGPCTTRMQ